MKDLVVVGAAGFGREALDVVAAVNQACPEPCWRVLGVLDDGPSEANLRRLGRRGTPHLGALDPWLAGARTDVHYVIGIGDPTIRARLSARLDAAGHPAATLVHPSVTHGHGTTLDVGSVVCAGVQLSNEVRLGRHVHVNPNATIGHDTTLGEFASVNPGAILSGECVVEDRALIGAGAVVLQRLRIGADAVIGAAACVTRNVPPGAVAVGVPARRR